MVTVIRARHTKLVGSSIHRPVVEFLFARFFSVAFNIYMKPGPAMEPHTHLVFKALKLESIFPSGIF